MCVCVCVCVSRDILKVRKLGCSLKSDHEGGTEIVGGRKKSINPPKISHAMKQSLL